MTELSKEVIGALRSWQTVFSCSCGGMLWHFDADDVEELRCDRCQRSMPLDHVVVQPVYDSFYGAQQSLPLPPGLGFVVDFDSLADSFVQRFNDEH